MFGLVGGFFFKLGYLCAAQDRRFIIHNVIYNDYWNGTGYVFEKAKAQIFTKAGARNVRMELFYLSEYCDPGPIVIEELE